MDTVSIKNLIIGIATDYGNSMFEIVAVIVGLIVAFILVRMGIAWMESSTLGYMHGESGTARFRSLGEKGQQAWSYVDRTLSRRQIMRMDR